jgi:arsenate reductase (thioredoxin)
MKTVLFLCTGNACRSPMAEGLLRHLAGSRANASSAGTFPSAVHPLAVAIMAEEGIDISAHQVRSVKSIRSRSPSFVISLCEEATKHCPPFPRSQHLQWAVEDPGWAAGSDEEKLVVFRRVRCDIEERVNSFIREYL